MPSFAGCRDLKAAKYRYWQSLADTKSDAVQIVMMGSLVSVLNKVVPSDFSSWSYVCLPDTVDPRGPKGATR